MILAEDHPEPRFFATLPCSRALRVLAICALLMLLASGCSKGRRGSPFDPETGHPEGFFEQHPAVFAASSGTCLKCHGGDLLGGISSVSCSSPSRGERSCHPGGPGGGHPPGWSQPGSHGAVAVAAPGTGRGMSSCQGCHGSGFTGGDAVSCFGCHGVQAPHPKAPWRGSPRTHAGADPGNAPVCAQCHSKGPGAPGCFNATLCHGAPSGHPAGWAGPGSHGASAISRSPGLASCRACHGAGYAGGAGPACFSCHGWKAPHGRKGWSGGGARHRATSQENAAACARCHDNPGNRLPPGCFNASLCHGASPHPKGWAEERRHGVTAKSSPLVGTAGFAFCGDCHGRDFAGGTPGGSCFRCHGWAAPHGRTGWIGGGANHRTTSTANADVCARCHDNPLNGLPPGCYNASLCHGPVREHGGDWVLPARHGAAAKSAPGAMSGFAVCQDCHGPRFSGSIGPACRTCHGWGAPHGQTGWVLVSHPTVDQLNITVCALCHQSAAGTPGCYNGTLCHTGVPPAAPAAGVRR